MKKINTLLGATVLLCSIFGSCSEDLLYPECQTAPTSSFLYTNAEGLSKAVIGLYAKDRSIVSSSEAELYAVTMMDYCTDLMTFRGGTAATFARLNSFKTSTSQFNDFWKLHYTLIGKANEIIDGAKELGLEDSSIAQSYGEACCFRARSYFLLYQRFERLYLNAESTSVDNAFGRTFRAASKDEVFSQIKSDLDEAIKYLDWSRPGAGTEKEEAGRLTKAVAKHIRAQVALWEEDWERAATECEEIFANGTYKMADKTLTVFTGADYNNPEVLYAFQFSNQPGGGNSVSDGVVSGHRLALIVTPAYKGIGGFVETTDYGGYGWGRVYPNTYLFSLYDKTKDNRYTDMFQFEWKYNDPSSEKYGQLFVPTGTQYITNAHPCSVKHMDKWTIADDPTRRTSFRDAIVYRLAETALIASEAYFHMDQNEKALEFYNKTYKRATGEDFTGVLTLEDILEETARELHFEGVRWGQLKRLGLLGERVRAHAGDTKAEDPKLPSDYADARTNFRDDRDYRWPIPQTQLDLMPGFGQNAGWF